MGPFAYYWNIVTSVVCSITLSPFSKLGPQQHPIGPLHHGVDTEGHHALKEGLFRPPGSNIPNFTCDYSRMVGWKPCQGTEDKSCWLISDGNTEYNRVMNYGNNTFNTTTDYEGFAPWGIRRNYTLYVTNGTVNADGMNFTDAKLFNGTFPGPLIEACWGDTVSITVINNLTMNGTSVHWHGIRQNQTMHMDGVNGVTQCPIAPDDSYTYIWNATQYGSSWYHSHYSVQYADGAHAPITIHGPSTANYDVSIPPTILTDWYHNSAFECLYIEPLQPDILINGIGNITRFNTTAKNTTEIPPQYHIDVAPPSSINGTTKYLIRLMNTAFETGFVFSIDNHWLTIVEADFVPVEPYNVTSLVVAIGQRYNIIVEAKPYTSGSGNPIPLSWNFWIRTYLAPGCHNPRYPGSPHYEKAAILHYINATSVSASNPVNSSPWPGIEKNLSCLDSLSTKLTPAFSWTVEPPENVLYGKNGEEFEVKGTKGISQYGTAFISLERLGSTDTTPFQTTYGNPSFLNLNNTANNWPIGWMVVPENYTKTDWVYLVLSSPGGIHPMHLHGHDFAIVQTSTEPYNGTVTPNLVNPLRRDVVSLPGKGFVVIAFKTDNPGNWLMHCHIAFHAAGGLALQILERQSDANVIWPPGQSPALQEAQRVCGNWNSWSYDCRNQWPGNVNTTECPVYPACLNATELQNDSGI